MISSKSNAIFSSKNKKYKLGGNKILEFNEHIIALEAMIELDFFVVHTVHSSLKMLLC